MQPALFIVSRARAYWVPAINPVDLMQRKVSDELVGKILRLVKQSPCFNANVPGYDRFVQELRATVDGSIRRPQTSEKKIVNILFSDLRGFTTMAESYPTPVLIDVLNHYLASMSELIFKYRGTIDKFMGDSVMALFGAPLSHKDDLERAIACAIEMQIAMTEVNDFNSRFDMPPVYMGIGINTGEVFAGNIGSHLHSEYTVIGDEVNLAARVEAHSLRGQILLSDNSYQLAKPYITVGEVNEVQLKGRQNVERMYELLAMEGPYSLTVPCREVRKSPRVRVDLPLNFHRVSGKQVLPRRLKGRVIDISYTGMFALIPVALEPLSEIKIIISLSLLDVTGSDIYAKVLRIDPIAGEFQCHFEFTTIDQLAKTEIKNYVDLAVENRQLT